MKKKMVLFLMMLLCVFLCACGGSDTSTNTDDMEEKVSSEQKEEDSNAEGGDVTEASSDSTHEVLQHENGRTEYHYREDYTTTEQYDLEGNLIYSVDEFPDGSKYESYFNPADNSIVHQISIDVTGKISFEVFYNQNGRTEYLYDDNGTHIAEYDNEDNLISSMIELPDDIPAGDNENQNCEIVYHEKGRTVYYYWEDYTTTEEYDLEGNLIYKEDKSSGDSIDSHTTYYDKDGNVVSYVSFSKHNFDDYAIIDTYDENHIRIRRELIWYAYDVESEVITCDEQGRLKQGIKKYKDGSSCINYYAIDDLGEFINYSEWFDKEGKLSETWTAKDRYDFEGTWRQAE